MDTTILPARESVLQRALESLDRARLGERHHSRLPLVEVSMRTPVENGGGGYTIRGHAATTNSEYVLYESEGVRVRERVASDAFDEVLASNPDVHLNLNHDMRYAMARTGVQGIGGLDLSMDSVGLLTQARVSPNLSFVRDLNEQMTLGVVDQMSFAFTIQSETRTAVEDDDSMDVLYTINKIGQLYDVCICAQGANPQTDASIRSFRAAAGLQTAGMSADWAAQGLHAVGVGSVSVDAEPAGALGSARVHLAKAQAVARTRRNAYLTKE
jgi:HK97 family phage prohead protease